MQEHLEGSFSLVTFKMIGSLQQQIKLGYKLMGTTPNSPLEAFTTVAEHLTFQYISVLLCFYPHFV